MKTKKYYKRIPAGNDKEQESKSDKASSKEQQVLILHHTCISRAFSGSAKLLMSKQVPKTGY